MFPRHQFAFTRRWRDMALTSSVRLGKRVVTVPSNIEKLRFWKCYPGCRCIEGPRIVLVAETQPLKVVDATRHNRSKKISNVYWGPKGGRSYTQIRSIETTQRHAWSHPWFCFTMSAKTFLSDFVFLSAVDFVLILFVFDFLALVCLIFRTNCRIP